MGIGECEVNIQKNSLTIGIELVGFQSMNARVGGRGALKDFHGWWIWPQDSLLWMKWIKIELLSYRVETFVDKISDLFKSTLQLDSLINKYPQFMMGVLVQVENGGLQVFKSTCWVYWTLHQTLLCIEGGKQNNLVLYLSADECRCV